MAQCENCKAGGYLPADMRADFTGTILIGPCCSGKQLNPQMQQLPDVEYGIELSSRKGLRAYVNAGGLTVEFKKNPTELKELVSGVN